MTFNPLLPLPPAPRRGRCRNPAGFRQDYGGACRIRVELAGLGGAPPVTREFKVPRDTDNDDIADCWEEAAKAEWESTFGTNIAEAATGFVSKSKPSEPTDPDGTGPRAATNGVAVTSPGATGSAGTGRDALRAAAGGNAVLPTTANPC